MPRPTDRDGKSKTASAVDSEHYPEQNEVDSSGNGLEPDQAEVARRAEELWRDRGCRDGFADEDWFDAREELRAKTNSQNTRSSRVGGSLQP